MLSPRNSPKRNNSEPQELHEFFSASLGGAEVRKLSFWHDISAAEIPNLKRSDNRLAVFEARVHNYDFHFSHRGEVDGKALLRVGFDFGFRPVDPSWYFRKGGVDILIEPVRDRTLEKDSWKEKEKVEEEDFGWLFDQMKYLLSEKRLWDTKEEVAGVYFQLYDDRKGGTVTAGAMALFGEEVESAIYEMLEVEGIIGVSGAGMENKLEV